MRVLYAIQGTGNGHISRAREIVPILQELCDLDLLISGQHAEVQLDQEVKYRFQGLGFIFGKSGGVDLVQTFAKNNTRRFYKEIKNLDLSGYDLVINDFEPISAWAARMQHVPCVSLSHQAAVMHPDAPRPSFPDLVGKYILDHYAPVQKAYGFHFEAYGEGIYTPVIRREIRDLAVSNKGHFTVYLPAYEDLRILKVLRKIKGEEWQVFSKHSRVPYREGDVQIIPIENKAFTESLASCHGFLCGAGFEGPAEALFLGKKVLAIPMKGQYEQQCNAAALKALGVPVLKNLKKRRLPLLEDWVYGNEAAPAVNYPDQTRHILEALLSDASVNLLPAPNLKLPS